MCMEPARLSSDVISREGACYISTPDHFVFPRVKRLSEESGNSFLLYPPLERHAHSRLSVHMYEEDRKNNLFSQQLLKVHGHLQMKATEPCIQVIQNKMWRRFGVKVSYRSKVETNREPCNSYPSAFVQFIVAINVLP